MTIAREWAAYCRDIVSRPLSEDVAERARLCVADHLHAAMHGAHSETARILGDYFAHARGPGGESTALFVGAISAVHEIDDVHQDTSLHPGSVIVAAAMAAGAERGIRGARLLAAIVAGYEIAVRLSVAAGHRHYHYFHATATCGTVGAAAAASIVHGLDEDATTHAIGIAVTTASGLWEGINDEAVTIKHLHPGVAAERGLRAAKLAGLGVRSARHSIEGDKGFLAALAQKGGHAANELPSADDLAAILTGGLGERVAIVRNIFKRYPFCLGCFEPLEGLRYLLASEPTGDRAIERVLVETSPSTAWMVGQPDPQDEFGAKFSAQYALALVLAGHDVERAPLPVELLSDRHVRALMKRIDVVGNAEFGRRRARVTLTMSDGAQKFAERPFRNLDDGEAWARFSRACRQYLGDDGAKLEHYVRDCAQLENVAEMMPLVRRSIVR